MQLDDATVLYIYEHMSFFVVALFILSASIYVMVYSKLQKGIYDLFYFP